MRFFHKDLAEVKNGREYVDATSNALAIIINNVHMTIELVSIISECVNTQELFKVNK
jgi:hypothetical protein